MNPRRVVIQAAAIADGEGARESPGALLMHGNRVVAAGSLSEIGSPKDVDNLTLPDTLLLPALVNVHAHLDLTHLGTVQYPGDFVSWIDTIRPQRVTDDPGLAASVAEGVRLARAGGTAAIGDIAGARSLIPVEALRAAGLPGISFLEVFGLGNRQAAAIKVLEDAVAGCPLDDRGVRLGLQPHAPYSCGLEVFQAAAAMGRPLATHLAETLEELDFVRTANGPLAEMIRRLGAWDDSIAGHHAHPLDVLRESLSAAPWIVAHLNYINQEHVEQLAQLQVAVAYCPRASAYFGHPHAGHSGHRYREMLTAGINVALGTDSLACLETLDRISVLDDMRFLYQRDGTDPATLLRMGTTAGARGLGLDSAMFTFQPGPVAGVLALPIDRNSAVDPLEQVMKRDDAPEWIVGPLMGEALKPDD